MIIIYQSQTQHFPVIMGFFFGKVMSHMSYESNMSVIKQNLIKKWKVELNPDPVACFFQPTSRKKQDMSSQMRSLQDAAREVGNPNFLIFQQTPTSREPTRGK